MDSRGAVRVSVWSGGPGSQYSTQQSTAEPCRACVVGGWLPLRCVPADACDALDRRLAVARGSATAVPVRALLPYIQTIIRIQRPTLRYWLQLPGRCSAYMATALDDDLQVAGGGVATGPLYKFIDGRSDRDSDQRRQRGMHGQHQRWPG